MKTYIEQIRSSLEEIEIKLCDFLATVTMGEFHNGPYSKVVIITHTHYYRTDIEDEQKKAQIEINKLFAACQEHFLLLITGLPKKIKQDSVKALAFIQKQINLKSDWGTEKTIEENINRIRERFKTLYSIIALFEEEGEIVLIPYLQ